MTVVVAATPVRGAEDAKDILLFAAASTTPALDVLAAEFRPPQGGRLRISYGASSALARQIASGAPADLFISANVAWMDFLGARGALEPGRRVDLFANRLVLVAPAGLNRAAGPNGGLDLPRLLGGGRLAIADPDHVPAGLYAKAALGRMGLWQDLAGRLARMMDVRAALALAERGEVPAAIVYASDAHRNARVHVVHRFPADSHPSIVYPAAILAGRARPGVDAFFAFLASPKAGTVFSRFGFKAR